LVVIVNIYRYCILTNQTPIRMPPFSLTTVLQANTNPTQPNPKR